MVEIFVAGGYEPFLNVTSERADWLKDQGFITLCLSPREQSARWELTMAGAEWALAQVA